MVASEFNKNFNLHCLIKNKDFLGLTGRQRRHGFACTKNGMKRGSGIAMRTGSGSWPQEVVPGQPGQARPRAKVILKPGLPRDTVPVSIPFLPSVLPLCVIVSFHYPPLESNFMNPGDKTSYSLFLSK